MKTPFRLALRLQSLQCKLVIRFLIIVSTVAFAGQIAEAAHQGVRNSKTRTASTETKNDAKLGTSFRFDGTTLRGKYQTSLGTTATVESDKYLEDLLGARKHFKDRLQKDQDRN